MGTVHGLRSFEGVRSRATIVELEGAAIAVASLGDIIRSKRAAGRPRDLAVARCWRRRMAKRKAKRRALPPARRTNFLRKRRAFAPGSYL